MCMLDKLKRKSFTIIFRDCGRKNRVNRDIWIEKQLLGIRKLARLLDVGAGETPYRKYCKHLEYVSQDFCLYNGIGDERGLQTGDWDVSKIDIVCNIENIPEPDDSYYVILCTEVFQHIPDPVRAIQEFARLLKQGGRLILTTPVSSITHFAPYYFYNGFSRYFFEKYLPNHGFTVSELSYNGNYFESVATELQRVPYMAGKYSRMNAIQKCIYAFSSITILHLLSKFSANEVGSAEVLSHGIHIIAKKV